MAKRIDRNGQPRNQPARLIPEQTLRHERAQTAERLGRLRVNFRDEQVRGTIRRLFGTSARLAGSIGSGLAPGSVEIIVGGVVCGRGRSLGDAIRAAARVLSVLAKLRATAPGGDIISHAVGV